MKEEIIRLTSDNDLIGSLCSECTHPFAADDEVVICPRCKQVHHLQCWIDRGGCARHGCRQVMSPHLRPPKEETPITVKKMPRWALWTIAVICVALAVGIYYNSQRAKMLRENSGYVLVSSLEDNLLWNRIIDAYNETDDGQVHPATLIMTPYGPSGTYFDQKLLIMIAANDSPEFIVLEQDRLAIFVEQDALERLDPHYIDLEKVNFVIDEERLIPAQSEDGAVYGIPHPTRPAYLVVPRSPRNEHIAVKLFPFIVEELYREASR